MNSFSCHKVEVLPSEELSNLVPDKRGAIVEVDMESGNTYSYRVDFPKGEPENPLTNAELYQKFLDLAQFSGMSVDVAKSLVRLVEKFGENAKPSAMFAML